MYPSSGYGEQSQYYDDYLLLDGTYEIISVTLHSSSRDLGNTDPLKLRSGLLLAKSAALGGVYTPVSTAAGYLNGGAATQFMTDVVILAREERIGYDYILGFKRERTVTPADRIVPVYFSCNIFENRILYNNSVVVPITEAQWALCQRIVRVPSTMRKFVSNEGMARALLWKRTEVIETDTKFN